MANKIVPSCEIRDERNVLEGVIYTDDATELSSWTCLRCDSRSDWTLHFVPAITELEKHLLSEHPESLF